MEKGPTFKKKSHEKQFQFNATIMDKMEEATAALQQTPPAVEMAKTSLEEGMTILLKLGRSILELLIGRSMVGLQWRNM